MAKYRIETDKGMFEVETEESPMSSPISKTESFARGGVQGVSFGFGDEISGGIRAGAQGLSDLLIGNEQGSFGENYRGYRDEIRANELAAKQANPGNYLTGEIIGGVLPMLIPGTQAATVPRLAGTAHKLFTAKNLFTGAKAGAKFGSLYGLGSSEADLTKGDVGGAAVDTGIGAVGGSVLGAFVPPVLGGAVRAVGAGVNAVKKGVGYLGKKLISSVLSPSEEAIEAMLKNPSGLPNAETYAQLAENLPKSLEVVKGLIKKGDDAAWKTLKTSHDPNEGAVPKEKIIKLLNQVKNDPQITGGGTFGKATKSAVKTIEDLVNDVASVGQKVQGKLKSEMGVPSILKNKDFISESQLKQLIQSADDNIRYNDPEAGPANEALKSIRAQLDDLLKGQNQNYKNAMEPVAQKTKLFKKLKRAFNIKDETGEGLVRTDTTESNIELVAGKKKSVSKDLLLELRGLTGEDYLAKSRMYGLAKQFEGGRPQGSRSVNQMGVAGGTVGGFLGGAFGGPPGAAVGGGLGAAAGALTGGYIDKKGGQMAGQILTYYATRQPQKLGKYAPIFQKAIAASGGSSEAAVIPHLVLIDSDPQYKKLVEKLAQESEDGLPIFRRASGE